jgi:arylsulfatase A-like enzyme
MEIMKHRIAGAGEGALWGWISGAALALWEILLNADLPHGMLRLSAQRFVPPSLAGGVLGAILAVGFERILHQAGRRGRRGVLLSGALLGAVYLGAVILAAGPLRPSLFPLRIFSDRALSVGMFLVIMGAPGLMLLDLFRRALSGAGSGAIPSPAPPAAPVGLAACGALLTAATAALGAALPWIPASRPGIGLPVILLSIDTLRADRVGALGCPRPLTPRIDSLAAQGTVFENAESAAPWTLPSHASLFSSKLPYDHWARWEHHPLPPSIATLAEHFREAGYRTASFNGGGYVSKYLGLAQGFEIYEEHDESKEGGPGKIAERALEWVRGSMGSPFFLFLHTYEVHSPYTHDSMADKSEAGRLGRRFETAQVVAAQHGELVLTPGERRYVAGLYDSDVAEADRVMGGMLETLRKEGILDRVLLVVLSDHGEDLWDHDAVRSPGHGHSLYEEILHVPLIFRAPGRVAPGARIVSPVSLLEVAPTLLEMTGLPADAEHRGVSLAGSLLHGTEPKERVLMAESTEYGPDRFSLRSGNLKIVLTPDPAQANADVHVSARPLEVFDLASDPKELRDLSKAMPPGAPHLVETLWRRVEKVFEPLKEREGKQKIPEALREQLRSLGYVQ